MTTARDAAAAVSPAASARWLAWWRTPAGQRVLGAVLLGVIMLLVMLYRRPDQFTAPYIWVEDGPINVMDYLASGWKSLWHPIAGYYSLPIKLVHALSMTLSFRWLPEISMAMALLLTYAVLLAIAYSPTNLRLPYLCAVGVLLIPTDAENFAVSLYVGWWGSLLALLPLFWNAEGRRPLLRLFHVVAGGLSSPLIVALLPLYALRCAVLRRRDELAPLIAAAGVSLLQMHAVSQAKMVPAAHMFDIAVRGVVEKFFGFFLNASPSFLQIGLAFWLGLGLIVFVAASWLQHRRELGLTFVLLCGSLGAAILSSVGRMPADIIHPVLAGPRYFFFPYILLAWALIQLASLDKSATRLAACMILAVGLRNMLDGGRRLHGAQDWRGNIEACLHTPVPDPYKVPIHFTGDNNNLWYLILNAEQCRTLVQNSLFDNKVAQ